MTIDHYEIVDGKSIPIWKDAAGYFIFDDSGTLVRTDYSGKKLTSGSSVVSPVKTSSIVSSGAVIAAIAAIAVIFFVTRD